MTFYLRCRIVRHVTSMDLLMDTDTASGLLFSKPLETFTGNASYPDLLNEVSFSPKRSANAFTDLFPHTKSIW